MFLINRCRSVRKWLQIESHGAQMGFRDGASCSSAAARPAHASAGGFAGPSAYLSTSQSHRSALVRKRGLVRAPVSKPAGREAEAPFPHLVSLLRVRGETRVRSSVQSRSF